MKTKKLLSMLTLVCLLVGMLMVPAVTVSAAGIEIPANATLVHHEDCADSTGWAFSGNAKIVNGVYNISGNGVQLYAKNAGATYTLPEEAQFGKNAIITLQFYSQAVDHNFRVGFGGAYFGGNFRAIRNGKNYMTMVGNNYSYNAAVQSIGWHELAGVIDETGAITYYIDGTKLTDAQSTSIKLAEGSVVSTINSAIPGWNSTTEGAIADIKVYSVPEPQGFKTFTVGGVAATVDNEAGTIDVAVSEILNKKASFTLANANATVDIENGSAVSNGQVITYTNGDITKEYTVNLTVVPFNGLEIPENATLIHEEACTDAANWTLNGAVVTENAYGYAGSAITTSNKDHSGTHTFPEAAQLSRNVIATAKFYSPSLNHAFRVGFTHGTVNYFGGNYKANQFAGYVAMLPDGTYYNTGVTQSVGWHELAVKVDEAGEITYYIDGIRCKKGSVAWSETMAEGAALTAFSFAAPGWISGYNGAVADVKVYSVPEPQGIESFKVGGVAATIDEEACTIGVAVSEVVTKNASFVLASKNASLDIEAGALVSDGQTVTYTNGDLTKEYTLNITTVPFAGIEIPEGSTLVYSSAENEEADWEIIGGSPALTDGAYYYDGMAMVHSTHSQHAGITLPEEAQLDRNFIATVKFYSQQSNHAFSTGFTIGGLPVFAGGRYQSVTYGGNYAVYTNEQNQADRTYKDSGVAESIGWHEFAVSVDMDGKATFYIDGVETPLTKTIAEGQVLSVIRTHSPNWIEGFKGAVADAKVYKLPDPVTNIAEVNGEGYETLAEAVEAAQEGDTVVLLGDSTGAGVVIDKNITIDLGGYTYSFTDGVGSTGTESNGFQILKDNTVEIKNGTLNVNEADKPKFYMLIQNYANLTLTDVTLDGTNLDKWSATDGDSYVLSNNSGNVELNGETNIIANDEGDKAFAFDVCKYGSYAAPVVTVNTTGKIAGNIEVTAAISENLNIYSGIYTVDVSDYCADGFTAEQNADGTYGIVSFNPIATVNGEEFETLAEAVEAAQDGDTVVLIGDAAGAGVVIDKNITIDLGSYTYSFTDGVGSTGTESNGFQILKDNTVEIKNGTLNVNEADKAKFYMLIQNYANLTLTDVTLDGTNLDKWSATDGDSYVLSNNSGNVELCGETNIIANDEGDKAFAFDVCKYGSYAAPVVTVNTTGKIEGNIEVTAAISDNLTINSGIYTIDVSDYCADGFKAEQNADGTYGIVEVEEETLPFKDILTTRVQSVKYDADKKQITLGLDRYKFNIASATYGIALVPKDGETIEIAYNHDNGTAGVSTFKKFSSDKYSSFVTGVNAENGGGAYGKQPIYIIDRANGTRVYLDVTVTKADGAVETYTILVRQDDLAVEGDVDITEVLPLRADSESFVVDNEAKTIYFETTTANTSAGFAVAVDNGLNFTTRPRRLVTAKSGYKLAHGEIKDNADLQARFDRYVVARLSAGLEQTYQIKVHGGEDGLTYSWFTVTVKFNRVHEGDIEFSELLTKNADTCEFDNETNTINVTYSGESVAIVPVVVSGTRVYIENGIATTIDGVKAVAVKSENGAQQTAKLTLKIGNDSTEYTVNFNFVG